MFATPLHFAPNNRKKQALFICDDCSHVDQNAVRIIKKRTINLVLDSVTELAEGCTVHGASCQSHKREHLFVSGSEASKQKKERQPPGIGRMTLYALRVLQAGVIHDQNHCDSALGLRY